MIVEDFNALSKRIRKMVCIKWKDHPDVDDFAQEAVIQAWKYYMDGKDEAYIVHWSMYQVNRFYGDNPAGYTGSPKPSGAQGVGTAKGERMREKIRLAQSEHYDLHRQMPTAAELSRMTGIHDRTVARYLETLHHTTKKNDGALKCHSVDEMAENDEGESALDRQKILGCGEFENTVVASVTLRNALPELNQRQRTVVYFQYWQDMTHTTIAKEMGMSNPNVHKLHKQAIQRLRDYFNVEA